MRTAFFILLLFSSNSIFAATYYVDASTGNDQWSGKSSDPTGSPATDGPWLTISRVSAAPLAPGDSVLFKCGQAWHETLSIEASGTESHPITFGTYPSACATPPEIVGYTTIPSSNWRQYSGNIYKASLPINLINNSSFDTNLSGWTKWSQANDAAMTPTSACQGGHGTCASFTSGTSAALAISNNFALSAGTTYRLVVIAKIPAGETVRAIVRRATSPWDTLGLCAKLRGSGAWQSYAFVFDAAASVGKARLDFDVPGGLTIGLDDVQLEVAHSEVYGIMEAGGAMVMAHHPNRGYDPSNSESLYYVVAQDSASITIDGANVSTYLTTGTDFRLPHNVVLTPGTEVRIRTDSWLIDDRKVVSAGNGRLFLDEPSTYPIREGWGYYLYNKLWMLDEPGEYFYDTTSNTVYVWMPDSGIPRDRVSIGQVDAGIDLTNANYVTIEGIAIRNTRVGVRMKKTDNVTLRNMVVEDILDMGIDATQSAQCEVSRSRFARTGNAAISGRNGGRSLNAFSILDNDITESGVRLHDGVISSLPVGTGAAVEPGYGATISRNTIRATSYSGITPLDNSVVSDNYLENTCLVLDDGGAIYVFNNNNTLIAHNMVVHVGGPPAGIPDGIEPHAQGIYLDSLTSGITVADNTVLDARDGIQLHNASTNYIENNSLYGNRNYQIWLQEDTDEMRAEGDVYDNVVRANLFFPTGTNPAIRQQSTLGTTDKFASYDENLYFTFLAPTAALEVWPAGRADYTLPQWQAATTTAGAPRNLDALAREVSGATTGYTTYSVTGSNLAPNGDLAGGINGWAGYNDVAPYGQTTLITCLPGTCIRYVAGGSTSLLHSPNFSIVAGQWYRMTFDLESSTATRPLYVTIRRGGGGSNGYETLIPSRQSFIPSRGWERYSFVIQSLKTVNANDPVTLDRGARVDFDGIQPGQSISVTNLEIVPMTPVEATLRHHILVNPTRGPLVLDCPDSTTEPSFCSQFVRFRDGQPIGWPYTLGALDSEIIYSRDDSLTDDDGDGIPDVQDSCAQTVNGLVVNAQGCAFDQSYP